MTQRNRTILFVLLALTLIAAWFAPEPGDDVVEVVSRDRPQNLPSTQNSTGPQRSATLAVVASAASQSSNKVLAIRPRTEAVDSSWAFDSRQSAKLKPKAEITPVVATNAPVESSEPPVLPFRVLGRYEDEQGTALFLQHNERNVIVRQGDVIADMYKVETISTNAAAIRYLPLDVLQNLEIGRSK